MCVSVSLSVSICLSLCLPVFFCLCLCLSVSVSLSLWSMAASLVKTACRRRLRLTWVLNIREKKLLLLLLSSSSLLLLFLLLLLKPWTTRAYYFGDLPQKCIPYFKLYSCRWYEMGHTASSDASTRQYISLNLILGNGVFCFHFPVVKTLRSKLCLTTRSCYQWVGYSSKMLEEVR